MRTPFKFKPRPQKVKVMTPEERKALRDPTMDVKVDTLRGVDWHKRCQSFPTFVVFHDLPELPGKYLVRVFDGTRPTRIITISDTLAEARNTIPTDLFVCVAADPEKDNRCTVETWL